MAGAFLGMAFVALVYFVVAVNVLRDIRDELRRLNANQRS